MAKNAFTNRHELFEKLNAIGPETGRLISRALNRGALRIENKAAEKISNPPKTGRKYRSKHRKGAIHQASAPGEAPAGDSGRLAQSLTHVQTASGPDVYRVEAGANAPYAARLEFGGSSVAANATVEGKGTPNKKLRTAKKGPVRVYIAPRPFMGPSFNEEKEAIKADLQKAVIQGARSAKR